MAIENHTNNKEVPEYIKYVDKLGTLLSDAYDDCEKFLESEELAKLGASVKQQFLTQEITFQEARKVISKFIETNEKDPFSGFARSMHMLLTELGELSLEEYTKFLTIISNANNLFIADYQKKLNEKINTLVRASVYGTSYIN